jgi:hypothetical protein
VADTFHLVPFQISATVRRTRWRLSKPTAMQVAA